LLNVDRIRTRVRGRSSLLRLLECKISAGVSQSVEVKMLVLPELSGASDIGSSCSGRAAFLASSWWLTSQSRPVSDVVCIFASSGQYVARSMLMNTVQEAFAGIGDESGLRTESRMLEEQL
jgi:hypothetical protein